MLKCAEEDLQAADYLSPTSLKLKLLISFGRQPYLQAEKVGGLSEFIM